MREKSVPCPFFTCGEEATAWFEFPGITEVFDLPVKLRVCSAHKLWLFGQEARLGWALLIMAELELMQGRPVSDVLGGLELPPQVVDRARMIAAGGQP